jgi:hypothetical protein
MRVNQQPPSRACWRESLTLEVIAALLSSSLAGASGPATTRTKRFVNDVVERTDSRTVCESSKVVDRSRRSGARAAAPAHRDTLATCRP